jgi:hypothetical protein
MGRFLNRAAAFACATFSLAMAVPSAALASGAGSVPRTSALAGGVVVAVLGLAAMAALIVWRRRQPGEADGATDDVQLSGEPQLLDDELAA